MNYRNELISLIKENSSTEGLILTNISSLKFYTTTQISEFVSIIYEPSLCIAIQGSKAVGFGDEMYSYSSEKYLIVSTHIPANVRIEEASKEKPYYSIIINFTLEQIYDVIKELNDDLQESKHKILQKSLCFDVLDDFLLEPLFRLLKLSQRKDNVEFLSNLILKEIIYILLQRNSDFFKQYVLEGNIANQIVKAITEIKDNFSQSINMKNLSKNIGMSESSLYNNFKKITTMSPLQFQKKIRLEEAKQMLINQNLDAAQVAFEVGYESPSQFSREYSRMFGMSPKAHVNLLKDN
ncbi:transcriptional regulator, AraC family [Arcobacter acticola]|jgi:AraC-like DNA-binding protein|uniref:Transcriptional regulator, AraC family n=1 Tax=Arcobacter acticola TaxID=1849015 RepID=A0A6M8EKA9_9BACT|nr:AraC family transcriptional regulator [Arcobacter acticola]QKE27281.1 transcriptional regulator, AraC family [Arcobacter acticola]